LGAVKNKAKSSFNIKLTITLMGNLLYTIAVILVILWAIGYVGYDLGNIVHILLVIAVIAVLFRIIKGQKVL